MTTIFTTESVERVLQSAWALLPTQEQSGSARAAIAACNKDAPEYISETELACVLKKFPDGTQRQIRNSLRPFAEHVMIDTAPPAAPRETSLPIIRHEKSTQPSSKPSSIAPAEKKIGAAGLTSILDQVTYPDPTQIPERDLQELSPADAAHELAMRHQFLVYVRREIGAVLPPLDGLTTKATQMEIAHALHEALQRWLNHEQSQSPAIPLIVAAADDSTAHAEATPIAAPTALPTLDPIPLTPERVLLTSEILSGSNATAPEDPSFAALFVIYGYYGDGALLGKITQTLQQGKFSLHQSIAAIQMLTLLAMREIEPEQIVASFDDMLRTGLPIGSSRDERVRTMAQQLVRAALHEGLRALHDHYREQPRFTARLCGMDATLPSCAASIEVATQCATPFNDTLGTHRSGKKCLAAWRALPPWQRAFAALHAPANVREQFVARVMREDRADPDTWAAVPDPLQVQLTIEHAWYALTIAPDDISLVLRALANTARTVIDAASQVANATADATQMLRSRATQGHESP